MCTRDGSWHSRQVLELMHCSDILPVLWLHQTWVRFSLHRNLEVSDSCSFSSVTLNAYKWLKPLESECKSDFECCWGARADSRQVVVPGASGVTSQNSGTILEAVVVADRWECSLKEPWRNDTSVESSWGDVACFLPSCCETYRGLGNCIKCLMRVCLSNAGGTTIKGLFSPHGSLVLHVAHSMAAPKFPLPWKWAHQTSRKQVNKQPSSPTEWHWDHNNIESLLFLFPSKTDDLLPHLILGTVAWW